MISLDDLQKYSALRILGLTSYTEVFPSNKDGAERVARKLYSVWHPDRWPAEQQDEAKRVFQHIKDLYEKALTNLRAGVWGSSHVQHFQSKDREFSLSYLRREGVPGFGAQYISRSRVTYEVPSSNADLMDLWISNLGKLKRGPTSEMKEDQHLRTATQLDYGTLPLKDGGYLLYVTKDPDLFCLKHVLEKKGSLDPKHVAWILTRLLNLACLMQVSGVPNLDLTSRSVFIQPRTHSLVLMDGWQFVGGFSQKPLAIPARTARLCPTMASKGTVTYSHILTLIKVLGMECLGDPSGALLLTNKQVPEEMKKWLLSGPLGDAIKELGAWEEAKRKSFGAPTWVAFDATESMLYE